MDGKFEKMSFFVGFFAGIALMSILGFLVVLLTLRPIPFENENRVANVNREVKAPPEPEEPRADPSQLRAVTKDDHVKGNFEAEVTLIIFSDFQCAFCARFAETYKRLITDYKDKVRIVFRHFPLPFHDQAEKAALASECAAEQGKFWEMHDILFENQNQLNLENYKKWAKELKLNSKQFNDCLEKEKYKEKVQNDLQEGQRAGVTGTPSSFLDGEFIVGALPYEMLKARVEQLLK